MSTKRTSIERLLRSASEDEELAMRVAESPKEVAEEHGLKGEDAEFLRNLGSLEAVRSAYEAVRWKDSRARRPKLAEYVVHGLAGLFLLYLLMALFPDSQASPILGAVAKYRLLAVLLASPLLLLSVYFLVQSFRQVSKPAQVTLALLITVAMFVPGTVILQAVDPETRKAIVRVLVVLIFATLPSSFYVLFILNKKKTLWEEFKYNLQQLDPVRHLKLEGLYRKKFEALYGVPNTNGGNTQLLNGEAFFPILLNTVIIALGWVLLFFHPTVDASAGPGVAVVTIGGAGSAFTFGFLGAYLFSLQLLFRRYVQSDLRSTAYNHSSQRIVSTWVFALVIEQFPWSWAQLPELGSKETALLAFAVGVFPEIGWQLIAQSFQRGLGFVNNSFKQRFPLNRISGVTIWIEARLLEEDIENVQNLVTADIIDLMLRTNLHPRRIIDWIDQGVLLLYVEKSAAQSLKETLSAHGILTATDLLAANARYQGRRKQAGEQQGGTFLEAGKDSELACLAESVENSPNMYYVKAWRRVNRELRNQLETVVVADTRISQDTDWLDEKTRVAA